jgi:hypothetical protein
MNDLDNMMNSDSMFSEKDTYDIKLFGSYKSNLYPVYAGNKCKKEKEERICGKLEHEPKKAVKPGKI